ncbi:MAG: hypothetical protein ABFD64_02740 [Armatimonadota bacterium]
MSQPNIFCKNIWIHQQKQLLELFIRALQMLEEAETLPKDEVEITKTLNRCCQTVMFSLSKEGRELVGNLIPEALNVEQYKDIAIPAKQVKKPDFQYVFQDQQAICPNDYQKSLVVECKRLGSFTGSDYFNKKYVIEGICRYIDCDHSYGLSAPCGIMVGYIQNMTLENILVEVNAECAGNHISELSLFDDEHQAGIVSQLSHDFDRSFPIQHFTLHHLWADLGKHYQV